MASLFICDSVGLITNRLRNRASPTTTWLGGIDCSPRALRVSESTMTMRVKLVIIINRAGAIDSSVSATMIVMLSLGLLSEFPRLTLTEAFPAAEAGVVATLGNDGCDGSDGCAVSAGAAVVAAAVVAAAGALAA